MKLCQDCKHYKESAVDREKYSMCLYGYVEYGYVSPITGKTITTIPPEKFCDVERDNTKKGHCGPAGIYFNAEQEAK